MLGAATPSPPSPPLARSPWIELEWIELERLLRRRKARRALRQWQQNGMSRIAAHSGPSNLIPRFEMQRRAYRHWVKTCDAMRARRYRILWSVYEKRTSMLDFVKSDPQLIGRRWRLGLKRRAFEGWREGARQQSRRVASLQAMRAAVRHARSRGFSQWTDALDRRANRQRWRFAASCAIKQWREARLRGAVAAIRVAAAAGAAARTVHSMTRRGRLVAALVRWSVRGATEAAAKRRCAVGAAHWRDCWLGQGMAALCCAATEEARRARVGLLRRAMARAAYEAQAAAAAEARAEEARAADARAERTALEALEAKSEARWNRLLDSDGLRRLLPDAVHNGALEV